MYEDMTEQCVEQQRTYVGFEKKFFMELEQIIIDRKHEKTGRF